MTRDLILTAGAVLVGSWLALGADSDDPEVQFARARVLRVIDGETVQVKLLERAEETIRLLGISAPQPSEPGGAAATAQLRKLVGGRDVLLEFERGRRRVFGQLAAYVWLDVNAEMIRSGHAQVELKYTCERLDQYAKIRSEARQTRSSHKEFVYVGRTGKSYHRIDCEHVRDSKKPIEKREALRRGYMPCSRCAP